MKTRRGQRGSVMVEFSLAGIAAIGVLISTASIAIGMWNYHTLAYAVHEGTRYVSVKGKDCVMPGNTCAVTVGTIAQKIHDLGIGLPGNEVNVTFTTASGIATSCVPLTSCYTNTAIWPPDNVAEDNKVGKFVTISAAYRFRSPILFFWPGKGKQDVGTVWLPAASTQTIQF
jgi:hypothetical protein